MKYQFRLVFAILIGCVVFLAQNTAYTQTIQSMSAVASGPISIDVTWTHGGTSSPKYNVYVYVSGTTAPTKPSSTTVHIPGSTQSTSFSVNPSTAYVVKVAAVNSSGVETDSKTTIVSTPTNVPSGIAVTQSSAGQQVRVRWNYIYGMTSYKVYRSSDNGLTWITSYSGAGNFSSGNEVWAAFSCPAGSYKFAVTSVRPFGSPSESNKSVAVTFTVQ